MKLDYESINVEDKKRIKAIIKAGQLTERINRREILGKSLSQINQDFQFYNGIADLAEEILRRIE